MVDRGVALLKDVADIQGAVRLDLGHAELVGRLADPPLPRASGTTEAWAKVASSGLVVGTESVLATWMGQKSLDPSGAMWNLVQVT